MESYVNRFTTIFYTFVSAFGTAGVLCHLTSYMYSPNVTATVKMSKLHDFTLNNYLGMDQANLSIDAELDLREEFHWNQNQLFLYILARYESESNVRNEVIIWDEIVRSKKEAKISLKGLKNKYPLRDQFRQLKNKKIQLIVRYRRMPTIGLLDINELEPKKEAEFEMPEKYFRS